MSSSKNDSAWEHYITQRGIPLDGSTHVITATDLNEVTGREARLLAKFDTPDQFPSILRKHGYALLPVRNGVYTLLPGDNFAALDRCLIEQEFLPKRPFPLLTAGRGLSESQYIDQAYYDGILHEFFQVKELYLTIRGREYCAPFEFRFYGNEIAVESVQIEVDAGYEGVEDVILIEAKIGSPQHFNVRQLYYPYRHFRSVVQARKRVRCAMLTYDVASTSLQISEFGFMQEHEPDSLRQVKCARYRLQRPRQFTIDSLTDVRYKSESRLIPQADDLNKILELLLLLTDGPKDSEEIADHFMFVTRQSSYYLEAARYLGLVTEERELTPTGHEIVNAHPVAQRELFARVLVNSRIFSSLIDLARREGSFSHHDIDTIIADAGHTGSTIGRRRRTIVAWLEYLVEEFGCFVEEGGIYSLR